MNDIFNPYVSEARAMWAPIDKAHEDRKMFVENLGVLLSQTREDITGCRLEDRDENGCEFVEIYYASGDMMRVNVNADSYMAIIRDVTKNL